MWRPTIRSYSSEKGHTRSYRVVLSKSGPRGGKRPPLLDADVYATDQEDAIRFAKAYLGRRLRAEVSF